MTDAPQIRTGRDRLSAITAPRASAIPQAMRHSARVTRLRRWILWGAGLIVVSVGLGLLAGSLRYLPTDLNLERIALKGTSIVIDGPRLVGYQKDGRPYEIRARQGVQDITHPDVFDLDGLDIRIESAEAGALSMIAAKGHYNARADRAEMSGGVTMRDNKSFDMRLASAVFDLKSSKMISDKPVKVRLVGGEVDAKSIEFSEKERRASFRGGVHSLIYGEGAEPADALKPSP